MFVCVTSLEMKSECLGGVLESRQDEIAQPSAEAQAIAVTQATCAITWIVHSFKELLE